MAERPSRFRQVVMLLILSAIIAACTYQGDSVTGFGSDHPVVRKFTWFSYVGGEDIRAACRLGTRDRYRFVYNAVYEEQVRSYDLMAAPESGGYELKVMVSGEADLSGPCNGNFESGPVRTLAADDIDGSPARRKCRRVDRRLAPRRILRTDKNWIGAAFDRILLGNFELPKRAFSSQRVSLAIF